MQKVSILAASSAHQQQHALALIKGLAHHGIAAHITPYAHECTSDIVACWGWRMGKQFANTSRRVLVIERGYVGDRFAWTSLGWDGLNNRARFPQIDDGGIRFRAHFDGLLKPRQQRSAEHVLLVGQVPRDAALAGLDLSNWYVDTAVKAEAAYGLPTVFRPHPRAPAKSYPEVLYSVAGDLDRQIASARAVVTYNSNTGVLAALAGVPVVTFDEGAMAWDVSGHALGEDVEGDRARWAHRLAWKQWQMGEIEDGSALDKVLGVM